MRKFKFIGKKDRYDGQFVEGLVYPASYRAPHSSHTIQYIQDLYSEDWEEVFEEEEEEQESSPEQYYAGGNQINTVSISGFYNGVVFSLAGDFERCVKLFNFIGYLDSKK